MKEKGYIEFKKINDKYTVYFKQYEKVNNKAEFEIKQNPFNNLLFDKLFFNECATKEFKNILPDGNFLYPKPSGLIHHLIKLHPNKNAIVLDFFAGSGTTGHATLQLNEEDGGKRQFILCDLQEIAIPITLERLKTIMQFKNDKSTPWLTQRSNKVYGDSLNVYELKEISSLTEDIFNLINPIDYDVQVINLKEKINWICQNFEKVAKKIEE